MVGIGSCSILENVVGAREMGRWPCNWIILCLEMKLCMHHLTRSLKSVTFEHNLLIIFPRSRLSSFSSWPKKELCSNCIPWTTETLDSHTLVCSMYPCNTVHFSYLTLFSDFDKKMVLLSMLIAWHIWFYLISPCIVLITQSIIHISFNISGLHEIWIYCEL
jgi:hypothetical protein